MGRVEEVMAHKTGEFSPLLFSAFPGNHSYHIASKGPLIPEPAPSHYCPTVFQANNEDGL